jgi:cell division protein FtsI (penicillin-binding protein 3)
LHTPHDLEIAPSRQALLAQAKANEKDLDEGSPDHPGDSLDVADAGTPDPSLSGAGAGVIPRQASATAVSYDGRDARLPINNKGIVPAAFREAVSSRIQIGRNADASSVALSSGSPHANGTVVLDVEQGGLVVPSFIGKSVRSAIELAESSGLDLDVVGSGLAQEQSPAPGAHAPAGARITVKFGR